MMSKSECGGVVAHTWKAAADQVGLWEALQAVSRNSWCEIETAVRRATRPYSFL
jgi:hypothetical protein